LVVHLVIAGYAGALVILSVINPLRIPYKFEIKFIR